MEKETKLKEQNFQILGTVNSTATSEIKWVPEGNSTGVRQEIPGEMAFNGIFLVQNSFDSHL